jgi:hypothetical protein
MNPSIQSRTVIGAAAILSIGIITAAAIGAYAVYGTRALGNTLSVTGSAADTATADTATWTLSLSRRAYEGELASAQSGVERDAVAVTAFLTAGGIARDDIASTPVSVDRDYSSDSNTPTRYIVHQDVTVSSSTPAIIDKLSHRTGELAARGIVVSAQMPQYFISNLPQLRVALIGRAITDAKARAEAIAQSTGQSVGPLQSAASGVVQVLAPNSIDVSDYGNYDTSTIQKKVMVTARATFYLR